MDKAGSLRELQGNASKVVRLQLENHPVRRYLQMFALYVMACVLTAAALLQGCASREADHEIAAAIRKQVVVKGGWFSKRPTIDDDDVQPAVRAFYKQRRYAPAWTHIDGPTGDARALLAKIAAAPEHGLDPKVYDYERLTSLMDALKPEVPMTRAGQPSDLAALDIEMTRNFLKYATHLSTGQVNPLQLPADWHIRPRRVDMVPVLVDAIAKHRVADALDSAAPRGAQYAGLKRALAEYRAMAAPDTGGTPRRPVRGQPGPQELARRIRTIELNMERWRWIPDSLLGDRYAMVNIPDYTLHVVEHGQPVLAMRVVVGKEMSRTPMFTDEITYMVLNPTWNIPSSIAVKEILPEIQKDPSYLERNDMKVFANETDHAAEVNPADVDWGDVDTANFRYAIRQDPGPKNPVGHVKFMCPNQFNVYLHDTPAGQLFTAESRSFSHGCIRLEKPVDFAVYLMKSKGWSTETVTAAFDSAHNSSVKVPEPLPVRIFYWTAFVGDDNSLQFRDDVYGFDELLDRVLRHRGPDIKQPVRTALLARASKSSTAQNPRLRTRQSRKRAA